MKKLAAALFLTMSFNASAAVFTFPGSSGQPASEHEAGLLYGCASDGMRMFANTAAGYGRCKVVFPLVTSEVQGVGLVKVDHTSPDKSSSVSVMVYETVGSSVEAVAQASDFTAQAQPSETLTVGFGEFVVPGQVLYAVVEVRGDTKIDTVKIETFE